MIDQDMKDRILRMPTERMEREAMMDRTARVAWVCIGAGCVVLSVVVVLLMIEWRWPGFLR